MKRRKRDEEKKKRWRGSRRGHVREKEKWVSTAYLTFKSEFIRKLISSFPLFVNVERLC